MRSLALIALLGMTGCEAAPQYDHVHASTLTLKIGDSGCSGTAVGRYVLLTATHCVDDAPKSIQVNGKVCPVYKIVNDGADHALVTVASTCPQEHTATLTRAAKAGKSPKTGAPIFVWGSPVQFTSILRFGTVAGFQDDAMPGLGRSTVYDFNGGPGDSGAAIFDKYGRIVAVVSIGSRGLVLLGSFPLAFSREQYREAGI